jgi:hypothetical protein
MSKYLKALAQVRPYHIAPALTQVVTSRHLVCSAYKCVKRAHWTGGACDNLMACMCVHRKARSSKRMWVQFLRRSQQRSQQHPYRVGAAVADGLVRPERPNRGACCPAGRPLELVRHHLTSAPPSLLALGTNQILR